MWLRPEVGGKHQFFNILYERAPEDEQVEKNRMSILPCVQEISRIKDDVYTVITRRLKL